MATILIVEDEIQLAEAYRFLLERKGHTVAWAPDGEAGLRMVDEVRPDVIILDMMMPKLDGLGFLRRYKASQKHPQVKIILLSNMQSPELLSEAMELGVYRFELKASIAPAQLINLVDQALGETADS